MNIEEPEGAMSLDPDDKEELKFSQVTIGDRLTNKRVHCSGQGHSPAY
ncbi:hypothetical protein [Fodinicurvata sp. EGI_FJ10296]